MAAAKYNYEMIRGDSESIRVKVTGGFSSGDTVQMMVRESYDSPAVIVKTVTEFDEGDAVISFANEDTQTLEPGSYVYDLQVVWAGGNVQTLIEESRFRIKEDVTYGNGD